MCRWKRFQLNVCQSQIFLMQFLLQLIDNRLFLVLRLAHPVHNYSSVKKTHVTYCTWVKLIRVLGSHPKGNVSHIISSKLMLLSTRPVDTLQLWSITSVWLVRVCVNNLLIVVMYSGMVWVKTCEQYHIHCATKPTMNLTLSMGLHE